MRPKIFRKLSWVDHRTSVLRPCHRRELRPAARETKGHRHQSNGRFRRVGRVGSGMAKAAGGLLQAHLSRRVAQVPDARAVPLLAAGIDLRVVSAPFSALITVGTTVPVHLWRGLRARRLGPGRRAKATPGVARPARRPLPRARDPRLGRILHRRFLDDVCARPAGESNHHVDVFDR